MVEVIQGDCLDVLAGFPAESIDACVTDPPYHLTNRTPDVKWCADCHRVLGGSDGKPAACPRCGGTLENQRSAGGRGFMGKTWDGGDVAFRPETWATVLRVLKPGGYLLAFGGTRTQHRLVCAIEDAGFEVRDTIAWIFGSGFPKSHNLPNGLGTALKPAYEPICVARKPIRGTVAANVLRHGTGALNIDGCRVETADDLNGGAYAKVGGRTESQSLHGGSGMNVAGKTVGTDFVQPLGRWPANLVHDGSDEVLGCFPETGPSSVRPPSGRDDRGVPGFTMRRLDDRPRCVDDSGGSASRFFYTAKASSAEREGGDHPTVKPVSLMRWLVRLVCPPGGKMLDPFAGSGTTGVACQCEGFDAVLIEREPKYVGIARRRLSAGPLFWEAAE